MQASVEKLLALVRQGGHPSFLLIHGDDFLTREAGQAVLDLLAPAEERAFSLERFDGQAVWDQVEASLRTPSLFPGRKIVWVENPPYFQPPERKVDLARRALELWGEGEREKAAGVLFSLLRLAGWTEKKWRKAEPPLSPTQLSEIFGAGGKEAEKDAQALFAFGRSMEAAWDGPSVGEQARIAELLEQGLPSWAALVILASQVDRRTALYQRFREKGTVLDLELEREKSGKPSRGALAAFLDQRMKEAGKELEPRAREAILERAGDDLWTFHQEIEKLLLYAGEERRVRADDVEAVCLRLSDDWVFDLTRALAERNTMGALDHLENLLAQGEAPLKLLAIVANEVRRLLSARQLLDGALRARWRSGMSFTEFQRAIPQAEPLLSRNSYGDYMTIQRAEPFATAELAASLERIYETDQRLKSSDPAGRISMERLIIDLCRAGKQRRP